MGRRVAEFSVPEHFKEQSRNQATIQAVHNDFETLRHSLRRFDPCSRGPMKAGKFRRIREYQVANITRGIRDQGWGPIDSCPRKEKGLSIISVASEEKLLSPVN